MLGLDRSHCTQEPDQNTGPWHQPSSWTAFDTVMATIFALSKSCESYASYESYLNYPGFRGSLPSPSGIHHCPSHFKKYVWGFNGCWSFAQLGPGAKVVGYMVEMRGWALWVADLPSTKNNVYQQSFKRLLKDLANSKGRAVVPLAVLNQSPTKQGEWICTSLTIQCLKC